jgi:hypothetical protein
MRFNGHIDLAGNSLQRVNFEEVENFPTNPTPGRTIFKDGRVQICISISGGIPIWIPLTQELTSFVHDQTELSSVWVIAHPFNHALPTVQIVDENSFVITPNEIDLSVINEVTVTFGTAIRGKAVLTLGALDGLPKPAFAFEQAFTSQTTVVVNHALGYEPITRIFIGQYEVQPLTLVHNSTTQLTITFATAQTGVVRCI